MSESNEEVLTGLDLWSPNDYSNFITIMAAAIGSTLLVIFKSRCKTINLCWGLIGCNRDVISDSEDEEAPNNEEPIVPQQNNPNPNP